MKTIKWLSCVLFATLMQGSVAAEMALITQDNIALRAEPKSSAIQQAALWQGDLVEIRGQRLDYLQVYDYQRERGGYVHQSQLRRTQLSAAEAPQFLAVLGHLREQPGAEALGLAYAAAYLKSAPAQDVRGASGTEVFSAIGQMAERLAQRASGQSSNPKLLAHLDVAARYGVKFYNVERAGKISLCYDGEAYRYLLNQSSKGEHQLQAVLGLTRPDCIADNLSIRERYQLDQQRASLLQKIKGADLSAYQQNRLFLRRADVLSSLAYQASRFGHNPADSANAAITELSRVKANELVEEDLSAYNNSIMRVNVNRWASSAPSYNKTSGVHLKTQPGQAGETCVSLYQEQQKLLEKCSYGLVWLNSTSINREQNAITLAVQSLDSWREMWLLHKTAQGWQLQVLPPGVAQPELGYIEFAGWVPGGKQVIVAREWRSEGKYKRSYEVLNIETGEVQQQAANPQSLGALNRWADASWKQQTVSIR